MILTESYGLRTTCGEQEREKNITWKALVEVLKNLIKFKGQCCNFGQQGHFKIDCSKSKDNYTKYQENLTNAHKASQPKIKGLISRLKS